MVASLAIGFSTFLAFAADSGAIDANERARLWQACWTALGQAAARQSDCQAASEPARRFLDLLGAALAAGRAHVASLDGDAPPNAGAFG